MTKVILRRPYVPCPRGRRQRTVKLERCMKCPDFVRLKDGLVYCRHLPRNLRLSKLTILDVSVNRR